MIEILCYGDSNTWGYSAKTAERFPHNIRWTGVLQKMLGENYHVIEEGLSGRTTVWEDEIEEYKSGKEYLIPCLNTHKPLDLVIIMLGTNDLKKRFSLSAYDISLGAQLLAKIVMKTECGRKGKSPEVLLVSPIEAGDLECCPFGECFNPQSGAESKKFEYYYKKAAEEIGCHFLSAAEFADPSPIDAIHIEPEGHLALGKAVYQKVLEIFAEV